jgi:hypothetical protein
VKEAFLYHHRNGIMFVFMARTLCDRMYSINYCSRSYVILTWSILHQLLCKWRSKLVTWYDYGSRYLAVSQCILGNRTSHTPHVEIKTKEIVVPGKSQIELKWRGAICISNYSSTDFTMNILQNEHELAWFVFCWLGN